MWSLHTNAMGVGGVKVGGAMTTQQEWETQESKADKEGNK